MQNLAIDGETTFLNAFLRAAEALINSLPSDIDGEQANSTMRTLGNEIATNARKIRLAVKIAHGKSVKDKTWASTADSIIRCLRSNINSDIQDYNQLSGKVHSGLALKYPSLMGILQEDFEARLGTAYWSCGLRRFVSLSCRKRAQVDALLRIEKSSSLFTKSNFAIYADFWERVGASQTGEASAAQRLAIYGMAQHCNNGWKDTTALASNAT
ncbi:hypothetical protein P154DRAFT_575557 [Amniculicola lignicola CBS 123094]|uniref:Uncharacterized protein n=1 Tax=Amniculicola lignicola CBS 123094 TaxID=1392246 RepID=A0A6A5WHB8_9PLEO|nr:hypothetical protein P154DRAFT_575557 [Amniculicola lignicola CBS 123094]